MKLVVLIPRSLNLHPACTVMTDTIYEKLTPDDYVPFCMTERGLLHNCLVRDYVLYLWDASTVFDAITKLLWNR